MRSTRFTKGDIIYRNHVAYPGHPTNVKAGARALVEDNHLSKVAGRDCVKVIWLDESKHVQSHGLYFEDYFNSRPPTEVIVDSRDVVSVPKSEDPRTPEKKSADEVDALLHEYAEKMRKGFDGGTMAWPYSHLGLLAEFLMDYNKLEEK